MPITFFVREKSDWLATIKTSHKNLPVLSPIAQKIVHVLKEEGASFFSDLVHEVGHLKAEVENALWELVAAGVITADGFDNLRSLIDPKRRLGKRKTYSHTMGRWSLLRIKRNLEPNKALEELCWVLLQRYGVCFRELLTREKITPPWRELLATFRRLEDRGEIRGGRFVSGFIGEQFALPYAVDSLRATKKQKLDYEVIHLSAMDPLNLAGIVLPGEKSWLLLASIAKANC